MDKKMISEFADILADIFKTKKWKQKWQTCWAAQFHNSVPDKDSVQDV